MFVIIFVSEILILDVLFKKSEVVVMEILNEGSLLFFEVVFIDFLIEEILLMIEVDIIGNLI